MGLGLLIVEASQSHAEAPQSVGLLWTSDRPDAENSDNTHHSQQTDIHALGEIRTHNSSNQAAVDPHLRPRDRQNSMLKEE